MPTKLNYLTDPKLKTTTKDHDFKYLRVGDLDKVINHVHKDRLKRQQDDVWNDFCKLKNKAMPTEAVPTTNKLPVKSCLKKSTPAAVQHIKVLSKNEIENIVKSAMTQILVKSHVNEANNRAILENKSVELASRDPAKINNENNADELLLQLQLPQIEDIAHAHSKSCCSTSTETLHVPVKSDSAQTTLPDYPSNHSYQKIFSCSSSSDLSLRSEHSGGKCLPKTAPSAHEATTKVVAFTRQEEIEIEKLKQENSDVTEDPLIGYDLKILDFPDTDDDETSERNICPVVNIRIPNDDDQMADDKVPTSNKKSKRNQTKILKKPNTIQHAEGDNHVTREMWSYFAKITSEQKKMWTIISEIEEDLQHIPEIEDIDDFNQRKRRASEFAVRFTRNALYEIGNLTENVRVSIKYNEDLCHRVFILFQALHKALTTYSKQMCHFIIDQKPIKLEILITLIMNAITICYEKGIFDHADSFNVMLMEKCESLKLFLNTKNKPSNKEKIKQTYKTQTSSLSMYSTNSSSIRTKSKGNALPGKMSLRKVSKTDIESVTKASSLDNLQGGGKVKAARKGSNTTAISNVATAVQQFATLPDSSTTDLRLVDDPTNSNQSVISASDVLKLFEALESITKEQIRDTLGSILTKENVKQSGGKQHSKLQQFLDGLSSCELEKTSHQDQQKRNGSDLEILPGHVEEHKEELELKKRPAKNILITYVSSNVETIPPADIADHGEPSLEHRLPEMSKKQYQAVKESIINERTQFRSKCSGDPLYKNVNFKTPWKTISKISDQIIGDTLKLMLTDDFDFGEKNILAEFLQLELN